MEKRHRVNVYLSEEEYELLKNRQNESGKSQSEVLKESLYREQDIMDAKFSDSIFRIACWIEEREYDKIREEVKNMPIIKFVNESEKIEYPTEQDVCSLLCYAFAPQKTIMNDNQFVGCKPFGFPFWYMRNPLAVHQFMEFNHKRQFKHRKDLAKHRVISFSKEENPLVATLKIIAERIVSFYANNGYIAAYAIHFGTENPHIHVIVDTISYQNLNKFHMSRKYEWNQIHEILNDYSVQYITRSVSKRVRCENREYSVAVYLPKKPRERMEVLGIEYDECPDY